MNKAEYKVSEIEAERLFYSGLEFTPPARGTWTIAHTPMLIPESHEIFVCPEGCLRGVVMSAAEFHGWDRFSMVTVEEHDLYNGKMEDLFIEGITDILNQMAVVPPAVMVYTSCVHHFTAIDLNLIFSVLKQRFPKIDFIENYMNCTMRNSKLHYEEMTTRQLYAPLQNVEKDGNAINIVGNYFALDPDCELMQMLHQNKKTVRDICTMLTYDEYKAMEKAQYAIYTMPVAQACAEDLEKRIHQQSIYMPYCWDMDEIEKYLRAIAGRLDLELCDIQRLKQEAIRALQICHRQIKDVPIQIDYSATPRPLGLAKLLLEHGFHVTTVYCDAILPGEQDALAWLKTNEPDLMIRATIDFRCRIWNRSDAKQNQGRLLAIGQKATYFSGTKYFVNMVANDGLHGFVGIRKLAHRMCEAMIYEKEPEKYLSVKAKGCVV